MDVANIVRKLMHSSVVLIGPALLGLTVDDPASAQSAAPVSRMLAASPRADAPFTPWCAKYHRVCVSRPEAPLFQAAVDPNRLRDERFPRAATDPTVTRVSVQVR